MKTQQTKTKLKMKIQTKYRIKEVFDEGRERIVYIAQRKKCLSGIQ